MLFQILSAMAIYSLALILTAGLLLENHHDQD